ncbi:DUF4097 family beta strand repeat-containing protein [Kibdelosporangium lantanae]
MTVFETPEPVNVIVDVALVHVTVVASDRADTVVEVTPTDPKKSKDVTFAENTQVTFNRGELVIRGPKIRSFLTRDGSVDVSVQLPTGSGLTVKAGLGHVHTQGQLGDCEVSTGAGQVAVDHVADLRVKNSTGTIRAEAVGGNAAVNTAASTIRIGHVGGEATIKNSTGSTALGDVAGDVSVRAASGEVTIDRAERDVTVKTATGGIRLREVIRGTVEIEAAAGEVEIGVRRGSVAWLDLKSVAGRVRNSMEENAPAPEADEEKVAVRARVVAGDIHVHHA